MPWIPFCCVCIDIGESIKNSGLQPIFKKLDDNIKLFLRFSCILRLASISRENSEMANVSQPMPIDRTVTLEEISDFADVVTDYATELRDQILAPRPRKEAPVFTTGEVAELCGLTRQQVQYLATKGDGVLPEGQSTGTGRSRSRLFTLAEARNWYSRCRTSIRRLWWPGRAILKARCSSHRN